VCAARLPDVVALISHVETVHAPPPPPPQPAPTAMADGEEVCPQCHARFRDITALIMHAESAHPARDTSPRHAAARLLAPPPHGAAAGSDGDACALQ